MKFFSNIPPFLLNKFFLAAIAFSVWMLFFDRNDFFVQSERKKELKELKASIAYFSEQIEEERKFSDALKNNPAAIEKFAREKYLMKREDEDLYLIQTVQSPEKQ
ncbi:MAG TPA: septum formation initiator family protein [Chitinophagaceae bacterium]|nr:septum formation initiator family protein [Chitinophagaceae bacterium]